MPYFYLVSSILFSLVQGICVTFYNKKNNNKKGIVQLYSLIFLSGVFTYWLVLFLINRTANLAVLPYSIGFAVSYLVCVISQSMAYKTGSVVLTSLFGQLSMIGVSCWGFIFWNEKITLLVIIGLVLISIALWLCLYKGKEAKVKKFNLVWLISVLCLFASSCGCSIIQRTQQMKFDGNYAEFFMLIAILFALIMGLVNYIRSDKSDNAIVIKRAGFLPLIAAISNGFVNLFVIFLANTDLPSSLIYPVMAICGLASMTLLSKFVFKEEMRWWQWLGVLIGAIAVVLLSI